MSEPDPYRYFRVEAAELIERLGQGALAIDKGAVLPGGVAAMLRYAHTLKGAARVVKQIAIAERAHAIEDVLAPYRGAAEGVPRECAVPLLAAIDAIGDELAGLGSGAPQAAAAVALDSKPTAPAEPAAVLRAEVAEVEAVVDGLGEALVELEALERPLAVLDQVRHLSELLTRQLAAPHRVDADKLASLVERSQRMAEDLRRGLGRLNNGLRHGVGRVRRQLEGRLAFIQRKEKYEF